MSYWTSRENFAYYRTVRRWLDEMGPLTGLLDVGCWDTPTATWGAATDRWSVDLRARPTLPGVTSVVGCWPDCASQIPRCDVVTCLQVLEHLDDPRTFAEALLAHARRAVIVSVPWGWPALAEPSHRQDPIGLDKMLAWFGKEPLQTEIVRDGPARAVFRY